MDKYNSLKLENQMCFPLYACSKEIVRHYRPYLDKLNLTYTQYIVMLVLWEENEINVKDLGERLFLDSGTLTPLLKSLESKGYIKRERLSTDERVVILKITNEGLKLRDDALDVPKDMSNCIKITKEEAEFLYRILYKILGGLE